MDGMPLRFFTRSIFLPVAFLALAACSQLNSEKANVAGANPTGTSGSAIPPVGTVVNSAGFFLSGTGSSNPNMVQFMHVADAAYGADIGTLNFSSSCTIPSGSAVGTDMVCVAEVEELDLYFNTFNLQYQVPSNMCTYLSIRPYWFYDYQPGTGPTIASHEILANGTINDVINTVGGIPKCAFDHGLEGGGNCCTGTYSHVITTYTSNSSSTVTQIGQGWGGKLGNCAAGPGTNLSGFTAQGVTNLPLPRIDYVAGTGVNASLAITGPNSLTRNGHPVYSNVWTSNFYKPLQHAGGKPIGLQVQPAVPAGNPVATPSDTYDFVCLNGAQEVQQRIRLFIREWNEHSQLRQGGDPDTTGTEPGFPTLPINDRSDWLDFGNNYPASNL
jgi:hypothetical protein